MTKRQKYEESGFIQQNISKDTIEKNVIRTMHNKNILGLF